MWTDVSEERITSIFKVKTQPSKKPARSTWLSEDEGDLILRNVGSHTSYTELYSRR
jgi:hypothetical protein